MAHRAAPRIAPAHDWCVCGIAFAECLAIKCRSKVTFCDFARLRLKSRNHDRNRPLSARHRAQCGNHPEDGRLLRPDGAESSSPRASPGPIRAFRRAGMDYLDQALSSAMHPGTLSVPPRRDGGSSSLTTKAAGPICDFAFATGDIMLMGRESVRRAGRGPCSCRCPPPHSDAARLSLAQCSGRLRDGDRRGTEADRWICPTGDNATPKSRAGSRHRGTAPFPLEVLRSPTGRTKSAMRGFEAARRMHTGRMNARTADAEHQRTIPAARTDTPAPKAAVASWHAARPALREGRRPLFDRSWQFRPNPPRNSGDAAHPAAERHFADRPSAQSACAGRSYEHPVRRHGQMVVRRRC